MRWFLIIEPILEKAHEVVEFSRLYNWPRQYVEIPSMKFGDKVTLLFVLNNALKLSKESTCST